MLADAAVLQQARAPECVKFASRGRLESEAPFSVGLPAGLRFDLTARDAGEWNISIVDPKTPAVDYMWVASPPYQTAPHRYIAASYGQTVAENASLTRELHFVLNAEDHKRMFDLLAARARADTIFAALDALTTGTLTLQITGFAPETFTAVNGRRYEGFAWITFTGEACVPR